MAEQNRITADGMAALMSGDIREKMRKILPILSGGDGKKLMALLYLSGSDPQKLRAALEKAANGDGSEAGEIMSRLMTQPEGEAILARLLAALKS